MAEPGYHHSQHTKYTLAECQALIGRRGSLTLTGTFVSAMEADAGVFIVLELDEHLGFNESIGGDLELFEVED
jgi:hypothetical protein